MPKNLFEVPLTETRATDAHQNSGLLRFEGDKVYRFVKNAESATTFSAGQVVAHVLTSGTTAETEVKMMATANLSCLAGVVVASSLVAGYYGWIQIFGPGSVSVSGATTGGTDIAAGDYLKGVNAGAHMLRDVTPPTAAAYPRHIVARAALATTTTPAAALLAGFISCLK